MFQSELFSLKMLGSLGIPVVLTIALTIGIGLYWRGARRAKPLSYSASTFRDPINAGLSVAAFTVPLLAALLGYLALEGLSAEQLVPLYASTMLIALSVGVGLWNMFSTTAVVNEQITINGTQMWFFPAQVVAQFLLMAFGGGLLVAYLTLYFQVPSSSPPPLPPEVRTYYLSRPSLHLELDKPEVIARWGRPTSSETQDDIEILRYHTATADVTLRFRNGHLTSIQETKKE